MPGDSGTGERMQDRDKQRRTAEEWTQIISALKRSGLDDAAFAVQQGLPVARVSWWRARLERAAARGRPQGRVGLVRVDVGAPASAGSVSGSPSAACSWEVVGDRGRLIVYGELGAEVARAVLEVLVVGRPR